MPPADWDYFRQLPGSAEYNFEMLCRVLIRRHYGQYGNFVARANQPGVEFHLKMHSPCSLGDQGIWYGWQCRWYDLPGGRAIGKTRKTKIEKAIRTTERELPELTDWVLWTRRPLTKGDQEWYSLLKTRLRLHLYTKSDVEDLLSGDAEIFRGTYFGELVLTPKSLADLHKKAIAPIKRRWMPEVHQVVDAERTLNKLLGETHSWNSLTTHADTIKLGAESCEEHNDLSCTAGENIRELVALARSVSGRLSALYESVCIGDYDLLMQDLVACETNFDRKYTVLLRHLRASSASSLYCR